MYILVTELTSSTRHEIANVSLGTILLNIDSVLGAAGSIQILQDFLCQF